MRGTGDGVPLSRASSGQAAAAVLDKFFGPGDETVEDETPAPEDDELQALDDDQAPEDESPQAGDEELDEEERAAADEEEPTGDEDESEEQAAAGETLNDLWKASGFDPAALYDMELRLGDGSTVKLGDLKDDAQSAHVARQQLEEEREQFAQEVQIARQNMQMALSQAAALPKEAEAAKARMDSLARLYNETKWDELDKQDPGKAARARQKMEEEFNASQEVYLQAVDQAQKVFIANQKATYQKERDATLRAIPEWKDQKVAKADVMRIAEALGPFGFKPQEIGMIVDHRIFAVLRRFAQLDAQFKQGKKALKTSGKGKGRVLKPGGAKAAGIVKRRKRETARKKAKESRSLRTKAAYVGDILSRQGT